MSRHKQRYQSSFSKNRAVIAVFCKLLLQKMRKCVRIRMIYIYLSVKE